MLHLIRLELKKGKMSSHLWGSLIAYVIIAAFIALLYFINDIEIEEASFRNYTELFQAIDTFVRATFIIYSSVLLAKFIINEYRDRTMSLMFTYPISRKKLIMAKLSMVFLFTFVNVIAGNLLIDALYIAIDTQIGKIQDILTVELLSKHAINVLMQAIGAAGMSLIPIAFGMRKKSVSTTVVSSILIVLIVCSNNMGFSLSSIIAIPLTLAAIGILIAYFSFRNINQIDVG